MTTSFRQQVEDQKTQVENLKAALLKLQQKLEEARAKSATLIAEHRRTRAAQKAGRAGGQVNNSGNTAAFDRMKEKVRHTEATAAAEAELSSVDDVEQQFAKLEKEGEINRLLDELKAKRKAS